MTTKAEQIGAEIIGAMRDVLQRTLKPLAERLKAVEERQPTPGEKGEPGAPGKDAEPVDVAAIVEQIKAHIPTPKDGEKGDPGRDAEPVDLEAVVAKVLALVPAPKNGEKGDPGEKGERGEPGEPGASIKGDKGDRGDEGEPGRDAVHVDVLDGIDPSKRYQRGTFASHRGGLVRSFRATDPLPADPKDIGKAGWHTIVRGVAEMNVELAVDQRTVTLRTAFSDGEVVERNVTVPTMIYRGVWKDGIYAAGDTVTRDGCTWVAKAGTDTTPGAEGSDWQLAVKKGRDGRDGLKGEKGERGAEGKAASPVRVDFEGRRV